MPKKPTLASTLAELRKKDYQVGPLTTFDMRVEGLTTGNLTIDALTGVGGLPKGRVVELYGMPSSGKTTTGLQAAANLQQQPGCHHTGFWDHETALDESYVRALGVDPDAKCEECSEPFFLYEQPRSFEHGANLFFQLLPWLDLLITDSVAAMVSEHELEAAVGQVDVGTRGRLMYQYMRKALRPIGQRGTCMVFLNHIQDVIDTSPMGRRLLAQGVKRQVTPGGRGLKFYASLRMEFKQIGNIKSNVYDAITNELVSQARQTKTEVAVTKNKVGDPFGKAEVRVRFGKGFSNEWSALDVLVRHGKIRKDAGGVYRFVEPSLTPPELVMTNADSAGERAGVSWIKGEDAVVSAMEGDPEFGGRCISAAREIVMGGWDVKLSEVEIAEAETDSSPDEPELEPGELDGVLGQA